jgi:hypothetical protein
LAGDTGFGYYTLQDICFGKVEVKTAIGFADGVMPLPTLPGMEGFKNRGICGSFN